MIECARTGYMRWALTEPRTDPTLSAENAQLKARVRELEAQLTRERARIAGLERGLSALSAAKIGLAQDSLSERAGARS